MIGLNEVKGLQIATAWVWQGRITGERQKFTDIANSD
jgi:hypothetical protein